jgi:hypothetical protein
MTTESFAPSPAFFGIEAQDEKIMHATRAMTARETGFLFMDTSRLL